MEAATTVVAQTAGTATRAGAAARAVLAVAVAAVETVAVAVDAVARPQLLCGRLQADLCLRDGWHTAVDGRKWTARDSDSVVP